MILSIQHKSTREIEVRSDYSKRNRTALYSCHHISIITFTRMEPYMICQQQEKKDQKRKKNEKKHLKDLISNLPSCGGCGCCCCGGSVVKKDRNKVLDRIQKKLLEGR